MARGTYAWLPIFILTFLSFIQRHQTREINYDNHVVKPDLSNENIYKEVSCNAESVCMLYRNKIIKKNKDWYYTITYFYGYCPKRLQFIVVYEDSIFRNDNGRTRVNFHALSSDTFIERRLANTTVSFAWLKFSMTSAFIIPKFVHFKMPIVRMGSHNHFNSVDLNFRNRYLAITFNMIWTIVGSYYHKVVPILGNLKTRSFVVPACDSWNPVESI